MSRALATAAGVRALAVLVAACRDGRDVCASEFAGLYWPHGSRGGRPAWKLTRPATAMLMRLEKAGLASSFYGSLGMQHRWKPSAEGRRMAETEAAS